MTDNINNPVYSKQALEFVTVATEYCNFVETTDAFSKKDFITKFHKLLSYVYQKAVVLPSLELIYDENQKFVTEQDWNFIKEKVNNKLVSHDYYIAVENIIDYQEDTDAEYSLSELIADIYQDLKDFVSIYQIGNEDAMNDALYEVKLNFEQFWGIKLLALLKALHKIIYSGDDLADEEIKESENPKIDENNWVNKQWE
jgi:hypothetical protein